MKIQTNDLPYDSTYFSMSDVSPEYDATTDTLTLFDGEGSRRSWGKPAVHSTVVFRGRDLVAVHVGFHHKHRGGQGWHYWQHQADQWVKVSWGQLDDTDRKKVLDREHRAPRWAKSPGKLKSQRRNAGQPTEIAYKLVKLDDQGRLISLFDGETEYTLNKRLTQKARRNHDGGYYAYPTIEGLKRARATGDLVPAECLQGVDRLALLKVELGGTIINYGHKRAATYLTPLEIVETISA